MKTCFLTWQDCQGTRGWHVIGRLAAADGVYEFCYVKGVAAAMEAGFEPILSFPSLETTYSSSVLFPFFRNRIPRRKQSLAQLASWTGALNLPDDPLELILLGGGVSGTDSYGVVAPLEIDISGRTRVKFFVRGLRYLPGESNRRARSLERGEKLAIALELNNPRAGRGVLVIADDYTVLGWVPRHLVSAMFNVDLSRGEVLCRVIASNKSPAPPDMCLYVELDFHLSGKIGDRVPEDCLPLVTGQPLEDCARQKTLAWTFSDDLRRTGGRA